MSRSHLAAAAAAAGRLGRAAALVRALARRPCRATDARRRAGIARLPAAGMPWFMTVFGRDTLITSYQTLLLGPELAAARSRCSPSCRRPRTTRRSTPSRERSSTRCGAARRPRPGSRRYYGTVDATPLYLVLLSEVWRWTGRRRARPRLREPALRALEWIDIGDRDGDGFVEYKRRTERGLENQSWKDSGDSQRFADGRIASRRSRRRGAGLRLRREEADGRARPRGLGRAGARRAARGRGRRAAAALRRGLLDRRAGGYYALALDGDEAAGRLALLEHRPPALERDRPARARRRGRRPR